MAILYGRRISVLVGDLEIKNPTIATDIDRSAPAPGATAFKIVFKITKTNTTEPDVLELEIYNLSERNRARLQNKLLDIEVSAGYIDNIESIFKGKTKTIKSYKKDTDWITKIVSEDGGQALQSNRINLSIKKGTSLVDVFKAIATKIGVSVKETINKIKKEKISWRDGISEFLQGGVLQGDIKKILSDYFGSAGYDWVIQDEQLKIFKRGAVDDKTKIILSAETGLVGSPIVGDDKKVNVVSLLQPKLRPYKIVELQTNSINGLCKVVKVNHVGDTHGNNWYSELELILV